jgi:putative metallohydrolase (TIGR04338 family)
VSTRDTQRCRVYSAEQFVRTIFDRAAQHNSRTVDFFGEAITLPPEARFASVESVQRYVDQVLAMPTVAAIRPGVGPLRVRARRAATAAHYERAGAAPVIAVPVRIGAQWALRELVVLHEVSHHLCDPDAAAHGPDFTAAFCRLATAVMGPEAGHVLRVVYAKEGVR